MSSTTKFPTHQNSSPNQRKNKGLYGLCDLSPTRWKCNPSKKEGFAKEKGKQQTNLCEQAMKQNQSNEIGMITPGHKTQKQDPLNKASQASASMFKQ